MRQTIASVLALLLTAGLAAALEVGDRAPEVKLPDQNGQLVDVADQYGRWVVLAFYPADATPGCTLEARSVTANFEALQDAEVEVYGVSTQGVESKLAFCEAEGLRQTMLSDVTQTVTTAFGVLMPDRGIAQRVTFYIDPSRHIAHINREVNVETAGADILATVAHLREEAQAASANQSVRVDFGGHGWNLPAGALGGEGLPDGVSVSLTARAGDAPGFGQGPGLGTGAGRGQGQAVQAGERWEEIFVLGDDTVTRREWTFRERLTTSLEWVRAGTTYRPRYRPSNTTVTCALTRVPLPPSWVLVRKDER